MAKTALPKEQEFSLIFHLFNELISKRLDLQLGLRNAFLADIFGAGECHPTVTTANRIMHTRSTIVQRPAGSTETSFVAAL